MDHTADISLIKKIPIFLDLTTGQVEKLSAIARLMEINPGESPIHEGD